MVKQLLKSVKEYKKASILTSFTVVLEVIIEVIIPFLMAMLIDNGIDKGNMPYIARMGIILVVFAMISLSFGVLSGSYGAIASSGLAKNLRHDMFYNVQKFSFSNIDKFSTGSIITRLTTDVTNVQMAYQMILRFAFRSPVMLIFCLVMSFNISAKLSLIFLACIPVIGFGLFLIISKTHPIFERVFKTYDKLNTVVQENLSGIRVVKSFVREDHEIEKFKVISKDIYKDFSKAEKNLAFNMPLMQFCVYTCMLLISWIGARLIVGSELTTGQLMSLIAYTMQILMSLMMLSFVFVLIIISKASAQRIAEVLVEETDLKNGDNPKFTVDDGSIIFENVSFSYANDANKLCLKNVNLHIKSGETVGILGGTGSSKTSLVQLIPRLYDVTGGNILVAGVNVKDYDLETLRNQVSIVLQKNLLFSGTIKENLRWGNENASDEELIRVSKLAQAHDFIQGFPKKYDTYIEQGGTNVSGGQKQRISIARSLLKRPKILILDDSTSAVDTKTDALIRSALRDELPGTTKIIIAQRISSIEDADKIVVLQDGKINGIGSHEELLENNEIYQEVYYSQSKGGSLDV